MRYSSQQPPASVRPDLRRYLSEETENIQRVLEQPEFDIITLPVLQALPARPRTGMVAYFAATVATANEGLHRYDTSDTWTFIG